MSVIIEICSTEIKTRSGISLRTNKPYSMREQIAYVHKGEPYPDRIKITLEDDQEPLSIGTYNLSPQSFYVDQYDSLCVKPMLVPRIETPVFVPNKDPIDKSETISTAAAALALDPIPETEPAGIKKFK